MNDMLTNSTNDFANELQITAKRDLTNNILQEASNYLKGSQVMELNKTLNKHFEGYEIYVERDVDLYKNYVQENKTIVELYLNNKRLEGLSTRTLSYYEYVIKKFLKFVDKPLSDVVSQDIRDYLGHVQSTGTCGNVTLDSLRRNLNTFFNTISNEGYIQSNPMAKIKKIKAPKKVKKPYSEIEIEKMRDAISKLPENTPLQQLTKIRDHAIFELLLSSGIRLRECGQLNKSDIDLQNRTFTVLGKGNKERTCYFSVKCQFYLSKLLNFEYRGNTLKYADSPVLFTSKSSKNEGYRWGLNGIERRFRELGQKCGVRAHPHKFRRTFATTLVNKGVPIEQIKELLGHANLDTTMIYAIVDQDQVKYNHNKYAG